MPRLSLALALAVAVSALSFAGARAETLLFPGRNLEVVIDVDHCALAGAIMCGGTGSLVPAAVGNDSIVAVFVHVRANNGTPVGGLAQSAFDLSDVFNPSGVGLAIVDATVCPNCFSELPNGVYRMAVRPVAANWGTGTYVTYLEVTGAAGSARSLLALDVAP